MKLKKIELREENTTMSANEMKNILGGQVIDPGYCDLRNDKCSGGCKPKIVNGIWESKKCTMSKLTIMGITTYSCGCN